MVEPTFQDVLEKSEALGLVVTSRAAELWRSYTSEQRRELVERLDMQHQERSRGACEPINRLDRQAGEEDREGGRKPARFNAGGGHLWHERADMLRGRVGAFKRACGVAGIEIPDPLRIVLDVEKPRARKHKRVFDPLRSDPIFLADVAFWLEWVKAGARDSTGRPHDKVTQEARIAVKPPDDPYWDRTGEVPPNWYDYPEREQDWIEVEHQIRDEAARALAALIRDLAEAPTDPGRLRAFVDFTSARAADIPFRLAAKRDRLRRVRVSKYIRRSRGEPDRGYQGPKGAPLEQDAAEARQRALAELRNLARFGTPTLDHLPTIESERRVWMPERYRDGAPERFDSLHGRIVGRRILLALAPERIAFLTWLCRELGRGAFGARFGNGWDSSPLGSVLSQAAGRAKDRGQATATLLCALLRDAMGTIPTWRAIALVAACYIPGAFDGQPTAQAARERVKALRRRNKAKGLPPPLETCRKAFQATPERRRFAEHRLCAGLQPLDPDLIQ